MAAASSSKTLVNVYKTICVTSQKRELKFSYSYPLWGAYTSQCSQILKPSNRESQFTFYSEDGGSKFFRNIPILLLD
jgi:hypothetical protein